MPARDESLLILGGAGLVGTQCAKRLTQTLHPRRVTIAALFRKETAEAVERLRAEFPNVEFHGYYGNLFVRGTPESIDHEIRETTPREFAESPENRRRIFDDTFGELDTAYRESRLARLIVEVKPDVIIDTVNTATGISYQDAFTSSFVVSRGLEEARTSGRELDEGFVADVEVMSDTPPMPSSSTARAGGMVGTKSSAICPLTAGIGANSSAPFPARICARTAA
jgi:hypothetical protein